MFYSHRLLARKSPLGTVWCAAHLQHRLNKSHYTDTDIPSTVVSIMFPETPIALRMSGHLLLGVVRIYSKKLDYLFKDCNLLYIALTKASFAPCPSIDLPQDATHAPFHTVTFPQTFELDSLNLDLEHHSEDTHLKSYEEITLTNHDQIPTGRDPYITVTLHEETLRASLLTHQADPGSMEEDDSNPSAQDIESNPCSNDDLQIETMRDAVPEFHMGNHPLLDDVMEPDIVLEKQILSDNETLTPVKETLHHHQGSPSAAVSEETLQPQDNFDVNMSFGLRESPDVAVRSTPPPPPPPPVEQPQPRQRKRRQHQHFDESTVLSNKFMKTSLVEYDDLRRVRKNGPCSSLGIWKVSKRLKKDAIFQEPLFTGLSSDLTSLYDRDYILSKPHLVENDAPQNSEEADIEIEDIRNNEAPEMNGYNVSPSTAMPSFTATPATTNFGSMSIPSFMTRDTDNDDVTPATTNFGSGSEKMGASTISRDSDMETPASSFGNDRAALSDIPEMDIINSAGELSFLEEDENSPTKSLATPESVSFSKRKHQQISPDFDTLSARTRFVANYLEKQLSTTPSSSGESSPLSINTILDGKTRKICSRMFYETLVLKSYGYVDVDQEQAYGDIVLKNFRRNKV